MSLLIYKNMFFNEFKSDQNLLEDAMWITFVTFVGIGQKLLFVLS